MQEMGDWLLFLAGVGARAQQNQPEPAIRVQRYIDSPGRRNETRTHADLFAVIQIPFERHRRNQTESP